MEKSANHKRDLIITKVAQKFNISQEITSIKPHGSGLMNKTYLITTKDNKKYILQQVSDNLGNIDHIMSNIQNVSKHLISKNQKTLNLVLTNNNKSYLKIKNKNYRLFEYIDGKVYDTINCPEDFQKAGVAFASFSKALVDFDIKKIHITIPDFHNTEKYYEKFLSAIKNASGERVKNALTQIQILQKKNHYVSDIQNLINNGLTKTVIHGDTKINNIIFDKDDTYVIDLDTIMKNYLCYDYGDAIRSGCNNAKENAPEENVVFNLNNYVAFTKGYLSVFDNLNQNELQSLFIAPMLVAYELSLRFLTDYLQNDIYFNTTFENENLVRCKNQLELLNQMEKSKPFMKQVLFNNIKNEKINNKINSNYLDK